MKIGVIANCKKKRAPAFLKVLSQEAHKLQIELSAWGETTKYLTTCCTTESMAGMDFIMALGGDGTMLAAVRKLDGAAVPVMGVNLGKLGFLTSIREEQIHDALQTLIKGNFTISKRTLLWGQLIRNEQKILTFRALNEILLGWGTSARTATISLEIDNEEIITYVCDGVLVATPTGSTAHSLSAKGPIVHPETKVFIINAICPHTLSTRPVVLPDDRKICLYARSPNRKLVMSADGQIEKEVLPGDYINICRSKKEAHLVQLPDSSYFSVLRQKLQWSGSNLDV